MCGLSDLVATAQLIVPPDPTGLGVPPGPVVIVDCVGRSLLTPCVYDFGLVTALDPSVIMT